MSRLLPFTLATLALGLVLMLAFDAAVTRVLGVAALFAFIVSGVFLIADPAFLAPEDDHEESPAITSGPAAPPGPRGGGG